MTAIPIDGRGVGSWEGGQINIGPEGGRGFWTPTGKGKFHLSEGGGGGGRGKKRATEGRQNFAVLHHKLVIFSAVSGGHSVGGGSSSIYIVGLGGGITFLDVPPLPPLVHLWPFPNGLPSPTSTLGRAPRRKEGISKNGPLISQCFGSCRRFGPVNIRPKLPPSLLPPLHPHLFAAVVFYRPWNSV